MKRSLVGRTLACLIRTREEEKQKERNTRVEDRERGEREEDRNRREREGGIGKLPFLSFRIQ